MDRSNLLLFVEEAGGAKRLLALQEAYALMDALGVSMERYVLYSHLSKAGYVVKRWAALLWFCAVVLWWHMLGMMLVLRWHVEASGVSMEEARGAKLLLALQEAYTLMEALGVNVERYVLYLHLSKAGFVVKRWAAFCKFFGGIYMASWWYSNGMLRPVDPAWSNICWRLSKANYDVRRWLACVCHGLANFV